MSAGGGLVALAMPGCYDGFDPLDPAVLAAVARGRGDAQGFEHSGVYTGAYEVLDCGCSNIESVLDVSLCTSLELAASVGVTPDLALELVQADGTARMRALGLGGFFTAELALLPALYGSLQADGRLATAGVLEADAVVVSGQVLGRIDGTIEREDDGWRLVGDYRQRYVVDLIASPDALDIGLDAEGAPQAVDCREHIALDLRWIGPPAPPINEPED
jgi:hypothetical protein